jgi:protein TonB
MKNFISRKTAAFFSLVVMSAAALTPAHANYFHNPASKIQLNIGSAPNPTPDDLRGVYPAASLSMNERGKVGLKISLSENGTVRGAVVESSSGIRRLDEAAVRYVRTYWTYAPPDGGEMPAEMPLTVTFMLR